MKDQDFLVHLEQFKKQAALLGSPASTAEQTAEAIVLVETQTGTLVDFNARAVENLGYTRKEFQKLKISDFEAIESTEEITKRTTRIVREGSDVTVVSYSRQLTMALAAAEDLAKERISCEVIDLRTISPLDMSTIIGSVEKLKPNTPCLFHPNANLIGTNTGISKNILNPKP